MTATLELVDMDQRPDLLDLSHSVIGSAWRHLPFMGYATGDDDYCKAVDLNPAFNLCLLEPATGRLVAVGHSAPVPTDAVPDLEALPQEGWDWQAGVARRAAEEKAPTAWLGAFSISVMPTARGRGLARQMIQAFRARAAAAGLRGVIAPVRPTLKATYPLASMADYIRWTAGDGGAFDPWIRAHLAVGGRILHPCTRSMSVEAHPARWEAWTGLQFPATGSYTVPGCLAPVTVDLDAGVARYVEPNVWIVHSV